MAVTFETGMTSYCQKRKSQLAKLWFLFLKMEITIQRSRTVLGIQLPNAYVKSKVAQR